jgi:hypothetical protein
MGIGKSLDAVESNAERLLRVWGENKSFAMGAVTETTLQGMLDDLRATRQQVEETRTLLTRLVDEANDKGKALTKVTSRGLSGIRATFGPDSPQYEQAGGTRESERKPRSSKKKT